MLKRNVIKESNANASWDKYHSSNLAPRAGNTCSLHNNQNGSSSRLSSMMAKNISFEKFSQVFSAKNANTTNKRPSSVTSPFDLNRNKRGGAAATRQFGSNSASSHRKNDSKLDQLPSHETVQKSLTMEKLQMLRQVQQTIQHQNVGKCEVAAGIVPSEVKDDTIGNLPHNFQSLRHFKSFNGIRRHQPQNCGHNADLDPRNHSMAASSHNLYPSQRTSHNNDPSTESFSLPSPQRKGGRRNEEWGGIIPSAGQPTKNTHTSNSGSDNVFQSMLSNDTEMKDLLQTLRTEQGPVKQTGSFVNEFIQPQDFQLKPHKTQINGRASVSCCMNEFSLRKTPSHSTLRPSRSILLEARYSNTSMASLASHNGSGERMLRRSSSSVKFSAPTVHTISGEVDKTMWYTKEDEKKMIINMIRSQKRKEARRRAKLMSGKAYGSPASSSPASSVRSLQEDSPPRSPEVSKHIQSNDQDSITPLSGREPNLPAKDFAPCFERIPAPTVNLSIVQNVSNTLKDCKGEAGKIENH